MVGFNKGDEVWVAISPGNWRGGVIQEIRYTRACIKIDGLMSTDVPPCIWERQDLRLRRSILGGVDRPK